MRWPPDGKFHPHLLRLHGYARPALHEDDGKLFKENIDSVSLSLANYFGDRTKDEYKLMLKKPIAKVKAKFLYIPNASLTLNSKIYAKCHCSVWDRTKAG